MMGGGQRVVSIVVPKILTRVAVADTGRFDPFLRLHAEHEAGAS